MLSFQTLYSLCHIWRINRKNIGYSAQLSAHVAILMLSILNSQVAHITCICLLVNVSSDQMIE